MKDTLFFLLEIHAPAIVGIRMHLASFVYLGFSEISCLSFCIYHISFLVILLNFMTETQPYRSTVSWGRWHRILLYNYFPDYQCLFVVSTGQMNFESIFITICIIFKHLFEFGLLGSISAPFSDKFLAIFSSPVNVSMITFKYLLICK